MTPFPYQYVVLRCVPGAEREEFLNVGVVLRSPGRRAPRGRLRGRAGSGCTPSPPDPDPDDLDAALQTVCDVAAGREGGGLPRLGDDGRRFGWLSAPRSTVVRPGPVHSGLTDDPAAEVQRLLDRLVR
ncbi:DUF3037 domain-containing protein [Janibacter limosus]|uniref:DUF3037 domain-containing protein n=1 Tax=Janibacter limosus TaxID=53458 RepID=A0AC61U0P7_9MICO|nr:DUF3037 domain-containing protein [Janibacter limosus]UUZ43582.1 DUF3037 domain-containing protein [Janibacter limosus]